MLWIGVTTMCDSHLHAIDANTDQAVLNQRLHILGALQTATLDFSALVACILDTVTTSIPDARAVLLIADAPGAMLACAGCHGLNQTDTEAVMQLRMSLLGNTSLLHPVIAARQTAYITNAMLQAHPQRSLAMQRIATTPFWVFPLVDADHIRGVLLVDTQCTDDTIASPTIAVLDSLRFAMAQALHQTTRYREAVQASQDVEAQVLHRTHELARALAK
jgi:GAF domain-containing protein